MVQAYLASLIGRLLQKCLFWHLRFVALLPGGWGAVVGSVNEQGCISSHFSAVPFSLCALLTLSSLHTLFHLLRQKLFLPILGMTLEMNFLG